MKKTYDKAGNCPVCGMDLLEQPKMEAETKYTCPMHPEVIKDGPGSCPICGMDLIPMEPSESEEDKTYRKLRKKIDNFNNLYCSDSLHCDVRFLSQ